MRYLDIDDIVFTNKDGNSFTLKNFREVPSYVTMFQYKLKNDEDLDLVAIQKECYGDGYEGECYRIFENNIVRIVDAGFDLAKLTYLDIPTL